AQHSARSSGISGNTGVTGPASARPVLSVFFTGLLVQLTQAFHFFSNLDFQTARYWLIPMGVGNAVRQVGLARRVGIGLVVSIAIRMTVAQLFHQLGRRVAQMHGYFTALILLYKGASLVVGLIPRIALG